MLQRIAYLENEVHLQDEIVQVFRSLIFCGELLMPTRSKNINRKYKKTELVRLGKDIKPEIRGRSRAKKKPKKQF